MNLRFISLPKLFKYVASQASIFSQILRRGYELDKEEDLDSNEEISWVEEGKRIMERWKLVVWGRDLTKGKELSRKGKLLGCSD